MITDGISGQAGTEPYKHARLAAPAQFRDASIAIVQISDRNMKEDLRVDVRGALRQICGENFEDVAFENQKELPSLVASLLIKVFAGFVQASEVPTLQGASVGLAASIREKVLPLEKLQSDTEHSEPKQPPAMSIDIGVEIELRRQYAVSAPGISVPGTDRVPAATLSATLSAHSACLQELSEFAAQIRRDVATVYESGLQSHKFAAQRTEAERNWFEFEQKNEAFIQDLVIALEEGAFAVNYYDRRKPHFNGPSLHIPSVIRYVSSNMTYTKIFQQRLAGGKHHYRVTILVDLSASMDGPSGQLSALSACLLVSAFSRLGISTTIMTFGASLRVVKTDEQQWDDRAMLMLLSCLARQNETVTDSLE